MSQEVVFLEDMSQSQKLGTNVKIQVTSLDITVSFNGNSVIFERCGSDMIVEIQYNKHPNHPESIHYIPVSDEEPLQTPEPLELQPN
jgi:hypothetical protein